MILLARSRGPGSRERGGAGRGGGPKNISWIGGGGGGGGKMLKSVLCRKECRRINYELLSNWPK